ncbi:MAG TPA: acylphosphatase [Pseudogracilibacillus sp.]|nr:acylphosphatase [Pseudogracilibacillus sp.]
MSDMNSEWLPHLHPEVISEVEGNYLDAYVVALEGWRRGLTLRWHVKNSEKFNEIKTWYVDHPGLLFSLHSEEKSHYFFRTRGDKVTTDAVECAMDKEVTKNMLQKEDVPVPIGKEFTNIATTEEIVTYANELGYPVVLKPTDGSFGRGVMTNITTDGELEEALAYVRDELEEDHIIVEKHLTGKDYRLYVVDREVVGAILRVPPNVVGDGVNTIEALIDIKNKERELNPRLVSCPIKINQELVDFIRRSGYTLKTVPEKGEQVFLSDKSNISIGGDPIDKLDELSDEMKTLAVNALRAIPNLPHGAVDMIIHEDDTGKQTGYIIELNPTAQLGGILFPIKGKARDIPKAIIDYYFPETKGVQTDKEKVYFDLHDVVEPLISRQGTIATVSPAPIGKIHMKKYTVFGDVTNVGYHLGLRKQAFERGLHGFVLLNGEDSIQIIVAGTDPVMVDDFKNGIFEDKERATVIDVEADDYDGYVKVGFDSRANFKTLEEEINLMREEIEQQNEEIKKLEMRRRKLQRSFSWRITAPIRLGGAIVKALKK